MYRKLSLSSLTVLLVMTSVLAWTHATDAQAADDLVAVITTNKGEIRLELYPEDAPVTVASFVNLASRNYYEGSVFHRVINNFMIQGGKPAGGGRGPGYKFEDETTPKRKHSSAGILSMANAGPGTNGSQFFITHGPTPHLDGKHTVFGHVIGDGQKVVDSIVQGDTMLNIRIEGDTKPLLKAQADRVRLFNLALDDPAAYKAESAKVAAMQAEIAAKKAEESKALFAEQDKREFEQALAVAKSRDYNTKKGVNSPTGLWSLVVKEGDGPLATKQSTIVAHTTGWLADGTKFWSSHDPPGNPMPPMAVTGFVPGFTEGLQTMKAGGKSLLIMPGRMGYGANGNPRAKIPPNATLMFEVELLEIK